ncbi:hypothetical protein SDRG_06283 [Saprolegnia diclina VS20]|uniref:Uncharacterized protein n=1 Tax=Saprolegnia diclina (strain VS20) TaxID=1156394 RepID=T0QQJ3_SAPDV|nr:hypothetical protein SDRG_06283 [Saprolegnia diclina VS20]EQC36170.1 hypothetical protein SDRG_06283 [Saprolegnia diclina VS20]|eukprot:XP_008610276.1 hypothetical protein SDRG_06283 [Saprolegnia diclina VS20]
MELACALEIPPNASLVSTQAVAPGAYTFECIVRPPLAPLSLVWLFHHATSGLGVLPTGHAVLLCSERTWATIAPCATENVVQHWVSTFDAAASGPALFCNGVVQPLTPTTLREGISDAVLRDGRIRLAWSLPRARSPMVLGEVRLWSTTTLALDVLQQWRHREVSPDHPNLAQLGAYWRLNDGSMRNVQLDLSGHGRDLVLLGFDPILRYVSLHPLQLYDHPHLELTLQNAPVDDTSDVDTFVVQVSPHRDSSSRRLVAHVAVVLDATATCAHDATRYITALTTFIGALPAHTDLCLLTTRRPTPTLLAWRRMDPLGQREAIKHVIDVLQKPAASAPLPLAPVVDAALHLLVDTYEDHPSALSFGALLVFSQRPVEAADELYDVYRPLQSWCMLHFLSLAPPATMTPLPRQHALQFVVYAAASTDLEFILADVVHRVTHVLAKNVTLTVATTGAVQVALDPKHDTTVARHTVAVDGHVMQWDIGLFCASDVLLLGGQWQWSGRHADESFHVRIVSVQAGALLLSRSSLALPPYHALQRCLRDEPSSKLVGRVRAEAAQAARLYEQRRTYLAHRNITDVVEMQKSFEKLRALKETEQATLHAMSDDVATVEQRKDVMLVVHETLSLLAAAVAPKASPKRATSHRLDLEAGGRSSSPPARESTTTEEPKTIEWVESIALLTAKANADEADAKLDESLRNLRQVEDDLKRRPVFITDDEICDVLGRFVTRLHETQMTRLPVFAETRTHVRGSKGVLLTRMASSKWKHATDQADAIRSAISDLQMQLSARRALDPSAWHALQPVLEAEHVAFLRSRLAWSQARFAELLKDRPVPNALIPFATLLVAPCESRGVRNAVQALLFSLRNDRDDSTLAPLSPVVQSHVYPIWWADEQLLSVAIAPETPDADVAVSDANRLSYAKAHAARLLVVTSNALCTSRDAVDEVVSYAHSGRPILHVQLDTWYRDAPSVEATWPHVSYAAWEANRRYLLQHLPAPVNSVFLNATEFECELCGAIDDVRQLLRSPCYHCSFFFQSTKSNYVAFAQEVADALESARCVASVSPLVWKTEAPTSTLPQLRRFYAERAVGSATELHAAASQARTDAISSYCKHLFDRFGADTAAFEAARERVTATSVARNETSAEVFVEYHVQTHRLSTQIATIEARLTSAALQLAAVVGDLESRVFHMVSDATSDDGDALQRYRRGIPHLHQLMPMYLELSQNVVDLTIQMLGLDADKYLYTSLAALDTEIEASMAETVTNVLAEMDAMEVAYAASIPLEAERLYGRCNIQTFALSSARSPMLDLDALQRAMDDVVGWETSTLQSLQSLFQDAHALHAMRAFRVQVENVTRRFADAFAVPSWVDMLSASDAPAMSVLFNDVVWCEKDCSRPADAWRSLASMHERIRMETSERSLRHRHRRCVASFYQTYVAACHAAWHAQCQRLVELAASQLAVVTREVVAVTAPRVEAEKAYRAALESEGCCRHQLRRLQYQEDENAHVRQHLALTMLQLRHLAAVESDLEAFARQENLKETKPIWDALAAFQAECFADGFAKATVWDTERVALASDRDLLTSQLARCAQNVDVRRHEWEAATWAHLRGCVALTKVQHWLYSALEAIVGLERKRQKDIECHVVLFVNGVVTEKDAKVEFADSHLIQATMLRLEVQKQARLHCVASNRARLLARLLRNETDLLHMTRDEALRKDALTKTMKTRCEFVDATLARVRSKRSTRRLAAYTRLETSLTGASSKSWVECMDQTAAFATDHWLVQHRRNTVEAATLLLEAAEAACGREEATYEALRQKQADAIAAPYTTSAPYSPLDTVHLMLYLNAKASMGWARDVNMLRTELHETMHLKRMDLNEWAKVDPLSDEFATARAHYIAAENDLVLNRFEIKCADAQAILGPSQCQQYVLLDGA